MNCRRFQDRLYEFVEGTLSAGARAAADQHLAGCAACREIVGRELDLARFLSGGLRQSTEHLALHPEIRRRILTVPARRSAPPALVESIAALWSRFAGQTVVALSVLLIVAFGLIRHFPRARGQDAEAARTSALNPETAVSVQVSYQVPSCNFRREGNLVMDTLSYNTVVAGGIIHPGRP